MILKSFFGNGIKAALDQARLEMGPEALLVSSRPAPPEARHLGDCEVVVASGLSEPNEPPPETVRPAEELAGIAELRQKLDQVAAAIARANLEPKGWGGGELPEACAALLRQDVDAGLVREIAARLQALGPQLSPAELELALRAELAGRIRVDPTLGRPDRQPRVAALVGPCGAGKTASLVKLAVAYGLAARRPVQILSLDSYRVAAAGQLQAYAAILGVGFQALETTAGLAQALEEHRNKELILIDTPGLGPEDMDAGEDLARFFASRQDIDVHLVLTASMRSADLTRVADRFEIFRPAKLLFTGLDEAGAGGAVFNQTARTAKPVSFLAAGQRIPEDLRPATAEGILDLLVPRGRAGEAAAA